MRRVRWPVPELVCTSRLLLEPLRIEHAGEAFRMLDDLRLHAFTGGAPATREEMRERIARQTVGHPPDGRCGWLNWMLRGVGTGGLVGTVQATLTRGIGDGTEGMAEGMDAEMAWVIGWEYQGIGYATEATIAVAGWLTAHGATRLTAHIHPEHDASTAVARRLNLCPTEVVVEGELLWTT